MSQWTITASSVVLIVIPLLQAFGVATKFSPQQLNVIQVILAVVVLVFGLLLSYEDFGVKAKAMHQCGVDLNNLHRISWLDASRAQINIAEDYHNILSRHDNHKTIDYQSFRLENRDEYFKERSYHWSWFKVWSKIIFGLLPYILTMVFLMYVMYFIFT